MEYGNVAKTFPHYAKLHAGYLLLAWLYKASMKTLKNLFFIVGLLLILGCGLFIFAFAPFLLVFFFVNPYATYALFFGFFGGLILVLISGLKKTR